MRKIACLVVAMILAALALAGYRWELAPLLPWDATPEQAANEVGGGVWLPWDFSPEVEA